MKRSLIRTKDDEQVDTDALFEQASQQWESGNLKAAFKLFLMAAEGGDSGAQLNVGNFYSDGIGVARNREKALYWYRKAYRQGYAAAASNIGSLLRNENKIKLALSWFQKAAKLKDRDASLEIAKIYLEKKDLKRAIYYLKQ